MGFPNNIHIKKFVKGQTIEDISQDEEGAITLLFTNGEKLELRYWKTKTVYPTDFVKDIKTVVVIIATPYQSNGEVKPSTDILK